MRIAVIGKFPPIQGGVSMRTYWTAHALAAAGHDVHVITNAREAEPPFRMHMRPHDWKRCAATYESGSVTVHWTDPADASQIYIPMASPFVSKLAGIAARLHAQHPFDVIYSHYLEPYGVAANLAAHITSRPHVVRMAGSDAGRLWNHPQLAPLYDHVLRSAEAVIAAGAVAERARQRGVAPARIVFAGGFNTPETLFTPKGPRLELKALRREVDAVPELRPLMWGDFAGGRPYFGVCGKLGDSKGSFALLAAMRRLKETGANVGLVVLAHGHPSVEARFRARARRLGLEDRILQLPFLPHWRVPALLRGSLATCCLEQDFAISFHTPMIPREVLLCGTCLVASTEVIRKLPGHERLPHGYGCMAVEDVNDVAALSAILANIVADPKTAAIVGARGCAFALALQREIAFPQDLEDILATAASRRTAAMAGSAADQPVNAASERFPLTILAADTLRSSTTGASNVPPAIADVRDARKVLTAVTHAAANGRRDLKCAVLAIEAEIAVAMAEGERSEAVRDPLFRMRGVHWALRPGELARLVPVRDPAARVLAFDHDVTQFIGATSVADLPAHPRSGPSFLVAFAGAGTARREPLVIDARSARILELCDGTRTASQIVCAMNGGMLVKDDLDWIESLFVHGLVSLRPESRKAAPVRERPDASARPQD